MAWNKKTWQDRVAEYPNRRRLDETGTANTYDVIRDEGNIMVEGDAFSAETMNDLENRINEGFNDFATRTVNGKPLSSDIVLSPVDVGAQSQTAAQNTMVKADASGELVAAGFDDFAPGIQFDNPSGMDYTNVWKFPNGLMIVTKTIYLDSVAITTKLEGYCVSTAYSLGAIPEFTERPYLTASVLGYDTELVWIANLSYGSGSDNKAALPNIRLASNYAHTANFYVNVQAIGRWK